MNSFCNTPSWTDYRTVLAEEFDISLTQDPLESHRDIRGHKVRIDEWRPEGDAKGTLLLVHGGGGNGRILAPLAEPMAGQGWKVLAPDLPGYGLTRPARGYRGEYSEWIAVLAEMADAEPGPVVMLGLSLGGLTAFLAAQQSWRVCGVIATTLLDPSDPAVFVRVACWKWLGRLSLLGMTLAPWVLDRIAMPLSLATPLSAMSSNERMQAYFQNDPLIGANWKTVRFFRTVHQHRVQSWTLDCPLLLVHPGADKWTPTELSRTVFGKVEADKQFIELSNGSHLPVESPAYGELLTHTKSFLDKVLSSYPCAIVDEDTERGGS